MSPTDPRATAAERAAAIAAVEAAVGLCRAVQGDLVGRTGQAGGVLVKGDASPVTVADFAAQALVCATLVEALGAVTIVGEESPTDLRGDDRRDLVATVADLVGRQRGRAVTPATVLDWIAAGTGEPDGERFWTLDPIDGTKGFLRGEQFAVALALIDHGTVVLGVLGCPNLPTPGGGRGTVLVADDGATVARDDGAAGELPVAVAPPATLAEARRCESVESAHSDHDGAARLAQLLGITAAPLRIDSQCKYAAVARGYASIYLRLPTRPGYREKIWDHAAGALAVARAGGRVTDVDGRPLDFSHGRRLEANRGVIATDGRFHDQIVDAVAQVVDRG
jgi:3'(2'), 5'-bisphosphate nucleotidase